MAYTYGGKDTPQEFRTQITLNTPGPDDIVMWREYTEEHKPGLHKFEFEKYRASNDSNSDYSPIKWTGVDCSGFCQHCITLPRFDDDDPTTQIVPKVILNALTNRGQNGVQRATDVVGSGDKDYARAVPYDGTNVKQQWMRGGDVIASDDHIVWVEGSPDFTPNAMKGRRDFSVYNSWGGVDKKKRQFTRKTIRMPFSWWGVGLSWLDDFIDIGRVYIWK